MGAAWMCGCDSRQLRDDSVAPANDSDRDYNADMKSDYQSSPVRVIIIGVVRGYIGIMQKKMETTI